MQRALVFNFLSFTTLGHSRCKLHLPGAKAGHLKRCLVPPHASGELSCSHSEPGGLSRQHMPLCGHVGTAWRAGALGLESAQGTPPSEWFRNSRSLWIFPWWVPKTRKKVAPVGISLKQNFQGKFKFCTYLPQFSLMVLVTYKRRTDIKINCF